MIQTKKKKKKEKKTLFTRMSVNRLILRHVTFLISEKKPTEKMVCI